MKITFRTCLFAAIAALWAGLTATVLLVVYQDPESSRWYVLAGFYLSIFTFFFGAGMFLLFWLVALTTSRAAALNRVNTLVRQSFFLAVVVDMGLMFQRLHVLNLFTAGLLLLAVAILELFFLNN